MQFISTPSVLSWDELAKELQRSLDHLDRLESASMQEMKTSSDHQLRDYATQFDLTRSDAKKVSCLTLAFSGGVILFEWWKGYWKAVLRAGTARNAVPGLIL